IHEKTESGLQSDFHISREMSEKIFVIPPHRTRYLSEISENNRKYDESTSAQQQVAQKLYGIFKTIESVTGHLPSITKSGIEISQPSEENKMFVNLLSEQFDKVKMD